MAEISIPVHLHVPPNCHGCNSKSILLLVRIRGNAESDIGICPPVRPSVPVKTGIILCKAVHRVVKILLQPVARLVQLSLH